jgi:hypothetical protein
MVFSGRRAKGRNMMFPKERRKSETSLSRTNCLEWRRNEGIIFQNKLNIKTRKKVFSYYSPDAMFESLLGLGSFPPSLPLLELISEPDFFCQIQMEAKSFFLSPPPQKALPLSRHIMYSNFYVCIPNRKNV